MSNLGARSVIPRRPRPAARPTRIPGDQVVAPGPPTYIWRESFNQADSTVLGPDLTWTKFPAVFAPDDGETLGNVLTFYGGTGIYAGVAGGLGARAEAEVGIETMFAQVDVVALNATRDLYVGVICGMVLSETYPQHQGFWVQFARTSGAWTVALYYDAGGVFLGSGSHPGLVPGDVIRVEYRDEIASGLVNGAAVISAPYASAFTDHGQCGGVDLGIQGAGVFTPGDTALDNFITGPLF